MKRQESMLKFENLSIKHKLTAIIMLTCGLMMVVIAALFVLNEAISFKKNAQHHLSALAEVTGINSTAALSFQDPETAQELLDAFRVEPMIIWAGIYTATGDLFAAYGNNNGDPIPPHINLQDLSRPIRKQDAGFPSLMRTPEASSDFFDITHPVMLNGKRIGVVFIRADKEWIYARLKSVIAMVAGIMMALIILSVFISTRLQRIISLPIESLSKTMQEVKHRQDYGVRVQSQRHDELGTLMEGFNDMLEQIQQRDSRLKENGRQLEELVALRTKELELSETQKKQLLVQHRIQKAYGELVAQLNSVDVSLILEKSLNQIAEHAGAAWGAFYLRDEAHEKITLKKTFSANAAKTSTVLSQSAIAWLMKRAEQLAKETFGQTKIFFRQFETCPESGIDAALDINSYLLYFQDRRVGVLVLAGIGGVDDYTHEFIRNASRQLGVAIHNALTFQDLRYKSAQLKQNNLELERASQMKSDFLANMSHELRTPLNAIIGFSELLVDEQIGELNPIQKEYLTDVLVSGRHLLSLINDILDLSKVEAGKMELDLTKVAIREAIESSLTMIREKAIKHGISLSIQAEGIPKTIQADERKFKQVLFNLVSNAAKFTEDGGSIAVCADTISGSWIDTNVPKIFKESCVASLKNTCQSFMRIAVTDNGIGIDSGGLLDIFSAFEQGDASPSKKYEGTGLGLALCKRFVELHHGAIWVESTLGEGSTFTFVLPMDDTAKADGKAPLERKVIRLSTQSRQPLVLVIDDDEIIFKQVSQVLIGQGCQVKSVLDGQEAAQQTAELQPDIVLLDVMLPGKDGWQVLRQLKKDPRTRDIPVIMCSAIKDHQFACSLGAYDYLAKPVQKADLVRCLENAGMNLQEKNRNGEYVLLVDDDPRELRYYSALLEQSDVAVRTAASGQMAITMTIETPPAVILQDLIMPDMCGLDVIQALKTEPLTQHIPIVILTAKNLSRAETQTLSNSIESIVQKSPANRDALIAEVKRFCPSKTKIDAQSQRKAMNTDNREQPERLKS